MSDGTDRPLERRPSKSNFSELRISLNYLSLAYPHSGYAFSQEEKSNWFLKRQGLAHPQN